MSKRRIGLSNPRAHWLAAIVLLLVILLFISGMNQTVNNLRMVWSVSDEHEGVGELVATARACQTFVARYDDLNRIDVMLADYNRRNSGPFIFYLRNAIDDEQNIASLTQDASTVKGTAYYSFEFAPLPDSAGRSLVFCLEAPQAELHNSITIAGVLRDTYAGGQAVFRDMWGADAGVQDLDFRLGYDLAFGNKLIVLTDRLTQYKPFICGDWRFYALLGIVYLALLVKLISKFAQPPADPEG